MIGGVCTCCGAILKYVSEDICANCDEQKPIDPDRLRIDAGKRLSERSASK